MKFISSILLNQNAPETILEILCKSGINLQYCEENKVLPSTGFPYGRKLIHSDQSCEIMLAHWSANLPCSPHNHGNSEGWVFFIKGDFEETIYEWKSGELQKVEIKSHKENSYTCINNEDTHSCKSTQEGLSLHIYFPRIEMMRVHDLAKRRTLIVSDNCGAWIPITNEYIQEEILWSQP